MGVVKSFRNLRKVTKRLGNYKFTRMKELIQIYGIGGFFRRVQSKMQGKEDVFGIIDQGYLIINESYYPRKKWSKVLQKRNEVRFTVKPNEQCLGKMDILTYNDDHDPDATIQLQIYRDGECVIDYAEVDILDWDYTVFDFTALLNVFGQPLDFMLRSNSPSCGILMNPRKQKRGFSVDGGGSVVCRLYTELNASYAIWMQNNSLTEKDLEAQRTHKFEYNPKISIIVPLYNTPKRFFGDLVQSVLAQTYPNWELCLADGSTEANDLRERAAAYGDARILYKKLDENKGIVGNSNEAIKMATGEYVALLDHDDTIMPQALYEYVKLVNEDRDYEFIYSDEDKLSRSGRQRYEPFFKPDFSPNMLHTFNYITHFAFFKRTLLDEIGYFCEEYNGAQDYDLILRATEKAKRIGHVPDILYNWRVSETSTAYDADTKEYTTINGQKAVQASFDRRGIDAVVHKTKRPNFFRVEYALPDPHPLISIIIPNKDEVDTLKRCVQSIMQKSTWKNYEIIIVENNSEEKETFDYYKLIEKKKDICVITWEREFNFAAINNFAAAQANGELLLFLNNDTSVITPDWLEQMAMHALRPDIGAVGAHLWYPDDKLQHGGVILRIGGVAGHEHKGAIRTDPGAFGRLEVVHDLSAVTAACVMLRKTVFDEVNGFDESFAVAFNDVDFCLRIRELGYSIVVTPYAELYHYESKSRGYETTPEKVQRFHKECRQWLERWMDVYPVDPFYNRNLTHLFENFSLNIDNVTYEMIPAKKKKGSDYESIMEMMTDIRAEREEKERLEKASDEV